MYDQLNTVRQGSLSIDDYMAKFDEMNIPCDIQEEKKQIVSRFYYGLYEELQCEIVPYKATTIEQAFQLTLEYKKYLKTLAR